MEMVWNQIGLLQSLTWSIRYPKTTDYGELLLIFAVLDQYFPILLISTALLKYYLLLVLLQLSISFPFVYANIYYFFVSV